MRSENGLEKSQNANLKCEMKALSIGILFVISAPSGGGKTTLCRNLLEANARLHSAITCTTRRARAGEIEGSDYYFLGKEAFLEKVNAGFFLEHAIVYGNHYGVPATDVRRRIEAGEDVLLNVDVQGASALRARATKEAWLESALVSVFLMPSSWEELERRLRNRASDSGEVIARRLRSVAGELRASREFDYLIVSESIETDCRRMQSILEAEALRRDRVRLPDKLLLSAVELAAHE